MTDRSIPHAGADEYAPYYQRYIERVPGGDALAAMITQMEQTARLLGATDEARATHRYAPGKWSVKQVVGHVCDAERVFGYRAMRFARGDTTPLPGFDEVTYAVSGDFDARPLQDLALELRAVRASSIALFASLPPEALARRGTANDVTFSARALAWIIVGHELHHRQLLIDRYGLRQA